MNKKQLIVAWVIGLLSSYILFYALAYRPSSPIMAKYLWRPTPWSYLAIIVIIGGLLICTLRNKKK